MLLRKTEKLQFLTDGDVSGCTEEGVEHDRVEGGVQAVDWRHSSQHCISETCGEKDERGKSNKPARNHSYHIIRAIKTCTA